MNSTLPVKKILLRKKSAGEQLEEVFREKPETAETAVRSEQLLYEGEIFNQFYRPLSKTTGADPFEGLRKERVSVTVEELDNSLKALKVRDPDLKNAGKALAEQIYTLAQITRETDIDVYLSAFNVVIGDRSPLEIKRLLDHANAFFTQEYYSLIRERGERPEIFHQIVKRVGSDLGDRVWRVVTGLDVEGTARSIWNLLKDGTSEKRDQAKTLLLDLTEKQLAAIRQEYQLIPLKEIASLLFRVFSRPIKEPELKRTIARGEVFELKKWKLRRSRAELSTLEYMLVGRTPTELEFVSLWYNVLCEGHKDLKGDLVADATGRLLPAHLTVFKQLILGWTPEDGANKINTLLFPESDGSGLRDTLSDDLGDQASLFVREFERYTRKFGKRIFFARKLELHERCLYAVSEVEELLRCLREEQIEDLEAHLVSEFGYNLPRHLLLGLNKTPARLKAEQILDLFTYGTNVEDLLQPILYLSPEEMHQVEVQFRLRTGLELIDQIKAHAIEFKSGALLVEEQDLIEYIVSATSRAPLWSDVLDYFVAGERAAITTDLAISNAAVEHSSKLAELLLDDKDTSLQLLKEFLDLSSDQQKEVETAFFECTDPQTPLLVAAASKLSEPQMIEMQLALLELDVHTYRDSVKHDSSRFMLLAYYPSWVVKEFLKAFDSSTDSLADQLELIASHNDSTYSPVELLGVTLIPEIHEFHQILGKPGAISNADLEILQHVWQRPFVERIAFERMYDRLYPRFRNHLKIAAAENRLPKKLFGEAILCFEGINPRILIEIQECFDSIDVDRLQDILTKHRDVQRTIEEVFDLVQEETTLRRSIKDMKIDSDLINETLLHLEGYYAKDVAIAVQNACELLDGTSLGNLVMETVTPESNPTIPNDLNWLEEMLYQVGLAYQRLFGVEIIEALRNKSVPNPLLEQLTERFYGTETTQSARQIFELVKRHRERTPVELAEEDKVCAFLETRGTRHRAILAKAYNALWGRLSGYNHICEDIAAHFKNPIAKKRLITLLGDYLKAKSLDEEKAVAA